LSGQSIGEPDVLEFIVGPFEDSVVDPAKICFEITETAAIGDLTNAIKCISSLKAFGCRFALDDFGSGLSSFAYLKNLSVDYHKIDGVFVKDIVSDPVALAMLFSINEIGHVMGKQTIAEFVEDTESFNKLKSIGVDLAQGYGIARPRPREELLV
jgi:EAL domain-containing protein (putative c-di-GMP-specific phosphodiesterase class I)